MKIDKTLSIVAPEPLADGATGVNRPALKRSRPRAEYEPSDPLLTCVEAAAERRQALSTFHRDRRLGDRGVPAPIMVGPRTPRFRLSEVRAGLEAMRLQTRANRTSIKGDQS